MLSCPYVLSDRQGKVCVASAGARRRDPAWLVQRPNREQTDATGWVCPTGRVRAAA